MASISLAFSRAIVDPISKRKRYKEHHARENQNNVQLERGINLAGNDECDDANEKPSRCGRPAVAAKPIQRRPTSTRTRNTDRPPAPLRNRDSGSYFRARLASNFSRRLRPSSSGRSKTTANSHTRGSMRRTVQFSFKTGSSISRASNDAPIHSGNASSTKEPSGADVADGAAVKVTEPHSISSS